MTVDIDKFVHDQLSVWPEAASNFRALKSVQTRQIPSGGLMTTLQFNPLRFASCTAGTDEAPKEVSPCFLCGENRPQAQRSLPFEGRKGRKYDILVNLFPIFPNHLLLSSVDHTPQSIWHRYVDMLDMAKSLDDYVIYYNGPEAGASAPFHLHFQACPKGYLPLERAVDRLLRIISASQPENGVPNASEVCTIPDSIAGDIDYITSVQDAQLFHYKHFTRGVFALRARTSKSMAKLFYRLLDCAPFLDGEKEPRFNAYTYFSEGEYRCIVVLRSQVRSHHYFDAQNAYLISPGAAEMAGYVITARESDYERLDAVTLTEIISEVSVSEELEKRILWRLVRTQPKLEVGIMSASEIVFEIISDGAGPQKVSYREGKIDYNGALYDELVFEAMTISTLFAEPSFILYGVTIGVDFHWQRKQDQKFAGTLKFIVENGKVTAVNVIGVEDYLLSVISSEMKASATLEFLKAHAVISRSWVMSQIAGRKKPAQAAVPEAADLPGVVTDLDTRLHSGASIVGEEAEIPQLIKWFDHDDHKHFDVCADDHCQRYQGLTGAVGETVRTAIDETWGQVMVYGEEIVDARFSKCCGGVMEEFGTCWEDTPHPYLKARRDGPVDEFPDLTDEDQAREWILSAPDAFCHTHDSAILSQVLNDYDLETKDFYRWKVEYGIDELSELVCRRSGIDFGRITALIPLERGVSGRIKRLRIVGTKKTMDVGKELIIRKFLSESHLFSSAFTVDFGKDKVILRGAGWGHGVGLCQIGAAVMAYKGYSYDRILQHYYPGSTLENPFS